jgi:hypothetical protein
MSMVHFYVKHHSVKARQGGGALAVRYLERRGEYAPDAANVVGYNTRTTGRWKDLNDLRARDVEHLPRWAGQDASLFFETAYTHERANGRWATSIQANLPRGLTLEQQQTLTRTFVQTHLPNRPTLWVIHEPRSKRDGLPQPHAHVLFSERLMEPGMPERGPAQMFKNFNAKHPERGGARKPLFGGGDRQAIYRFREAWCAAANVALEQAGAAERMDPRSFHVRGITRKAIRHQYTEQGLPDLEAPMDDERTPETRAQEYAMAVEWWGQYKRTMALDPQTMDLREALTIIATEVRTPGTRGRELAEAWRREQSGVEVRLEQPLIGNVRSKIFHAPGDPHYGEVQPHNQVLFGSTREATAAGYRRAVNQHYGVGAMERLQATEQHLTAEVAQWDTFAARVHVEVLRQGRSSAGPGRLDTRARQLLAQGEALGLALQDEDDEEIGVHYTARAHGKGQSYGD